MNRARLIAPIALLAILGIWYFAWLPGSYIRTLEAGMEEVPQLQDAYQNLSKLPFFSGQADERLAAYWDGRALEEGAKARFEHELIYRLHALQLEDTDHRRRELGRLTQNWKRLKATFRIGSRNSTPSFVHVALSSSGRMLAIADDTGSLGIWDTDSGEVVCELLRGEVRVTALAFSPEDRSLVAGCFDGTLRSWSTKDGSQLARLPPDAVFPRGVSEDWDCWVSELAFSPDGGLLAVGAADGSLWLWDPHAMVASGEALMAGQALGASGGSAISADGSRFATVEANGTVRIWETATGAQIGEPLEHPSPLMALALSVGGNLVATADRDSAVRIWDSRNGTLISGPLKPHFFSK